MHIEKLVRLDEYSVHTFESARSQIHAFTDSHCADLTPRGRRDSARRTGQSKVRRDKDKNKDYPVENAVRLHTRTGGAHGSSATKAQAATTTQMQIAGPGKWSKKRGPEGPLLFLLSDLILESGLQAQTYMTRSLPSVGSAVPLVCNTF